MPFLKVVKTKGPSFSLSQSIEMYKYESYFDFPMFLVEESFLFRFGRLRIFYKT
jgi:hypothetical protein